MSARWPSLSIIDHLSGAGLWRSCSGARPDTAAAISFGLFSAASRCFFNSASVISASLRAAHVYGRLQHSFFLHPLRDFHPPSQFFHDRLAQLRRCGGLAVHQVRYLRLSRESTQPGQQLWRIGVVAELFEHGDLRTNLHNVTEDLYFLRAALDGEPARARSLKSNEQHCILWIRQPLREMMKDSPAGRHSPG